MLHYRQQDQTEAQHSESGLIQISHIFWIIVILSLRNKCIEETVFDR